MSGHRSFDELRAELDARQDAATQRTQAQLELAIAIAREDVRTLLKVLGEGIHPGHGRVIVRTIFEMCEKYELDPADYPNRRRVS